MTEEVQLATDSALAPTTRWPVRPATVALAALLMAGTCAVGPRARVRGPLPFEPGPIPDDLAELESWVRQEERQFDDVIDGTEKRISWFDGRVRTEWSLVYIHGYSASRQETAPFSNRLAARMGANLFETRLSGHGRTDPDAMLDGTVEAWAGDAAEALTIGNRLGERVVVVGVSTGATLALWLALQDEASELGLDSLILVSPNLGVADPTASLLSYPWAPVVLPNVMPRRSWEPANDEQDVFWTHDYPTSALFPMDALVRYVCELPLDRLSMPVLVFSNPSDQVVDASAAAEVLGPRENVRWENVEVAADEDSHVLVGRIFAPHRVEPMVQRALTFLERGAE